MADMSEMKRKAKDMGAVAKLKAKNTGNKMENMKDKAANHMDTMKTSDKHPAM